MATHRTAAKLPHTRYGDNAPGAGGNIKPGGASYRMMKSWAVITGIWILGCAAVLETEDLSPSDEPSARAELSEAAVPSRLSDREPAPADDEEGGKRAQKRKRGTNRCFGGSVFVDGACVACTDDNQCRGDCNLETGRCSAAGFCLTADGCLAGQVCDGGMCIHASDLEGPCNVGGIHFGWDSAVIPPKTAARLADAASCIARIPGQFYLEGHGDNPGTEEFNILLTDRRCIAVRDFLVEHGVPKGNVQLIAKGSLEATGTDEAGHARDRSVRLLMP